MRVRNGATYRFQPVGIDVWSPSSTSQPGQLVTVKALPGCPKPGTMGHCHIVDAESGRFLGLVLVNSLQPRNG